MRLAIIAAALLLGSTQTHAQAQTKAQAQDNKPLHRIARIVVDSAQLDAYRAALKTNMEASLHLEPGGVLKLEATYEKDNPTHFTVIEIYASRAAYESHLQTAHFKRYKATVKDMVRSLQLTDVIPL